jgi:hypothetical protein
MAEVQRERGLPIAAGGRVDARGSAAARLPSIGRDHQPCRNHGAALATNSHLLVRDVEYLRLVGDPAQSRQPTRAALQSLEQEPVLDVVAERIEPDLGRGEADLRSAQQPRGRVDDAHRPHRRRMVAAERPDPKSVERGGRAGEQERGAVIGRRRSLGHQRGLDPRRRQRNGHGQPGRTAADHHNVRCHTVHSPFAQICPADDADCPADDNV